MLHQSGLHSGRQFTFAWMEIGRVGGRQLRRMGIQHQPVQRPQKAKGQGRAAWPQVGIGICEFGKLVANCTIGNAVSRDQRAQKGGEIGPQFSAGARLR